MILKGALIPVFFFFITCNVFSQSEPLVLSLEKALEMSRDSRSVLIAEARIRLAREESKNHRILPPADLLFQRGQMVSSHHDYNVEFLQSTGPVYSYYTRKRIGEKALEQKQLEFEMSINELEMKVKQVWYNRLYHNENFIHKSQLLHYHKEKERIAELQHRTGEIGTIELVTIKTNTALAFSELEDSKAEILRTDRLLKHLISADNEIIIPDHPLEMYTIEFSTGLTKDFSGRNLQSGYYALSAELAELNTFMAKTSMLPEISAGFFQRSINGTSGMYGWQINLNIPLWFLPGNNDRAEAMIQSEIASYKLEQSINEQEMIIDELIHRLDQIYEKIRFFNQDALGNADFLEKTVLLRSENEDIEFDELFRAMVWVSEIRQAYLETLNEYNQTAIQLEYYVK
ncbi:MAG: TolC family protein [Bacteroidales bacterium]